LLVPLLLFACDREPVAPGDTPTLDITNGPAASGVVIRGEGVAAWAWPDVKSGLQVVAGVDMLEFCAGIINFDVTPIKYANLPDGRINELAQGMVQATVWDFVDFDCALFTTRDPVASGVARYQYTDNDVTLAGENSADSWGVTVHGTLARPNGDEAALAAHFRALIRDGAFVHGVYRVSLK
jgi:hypothetical protein